MTIAPEQPGSSFPAGVTATPETLQGAERSLRHEAKPATPLDRLPLHGRAKRVAEWLTVVLGVYVLITAVGAIGDGFKMAAGDQVDTLFAFAQNPLIALMIGLLATALTQSSSTTTSIVVGLVAGGLPMSIAIPMLMGANIGTTMTCTLVSLGMMKDKTVFRRAFAAATIHDFFNLLAVLIFLPLEMMFGILDKVSAAMAEATAGSDGGPLAAVFGGLGAGVTAVTDPPGEALAHLTGFLPAPWDGIVLIAVGIALILAVINLIGVMLKALMIGRAASIVHNAIGRGPLSGIFSGTLITVLVQSSSTTTSLTVPLAGSGMFRLKQIYPFVVGANIGTTVTALIAAFGFTGAEAPLALQAAYVHLMFNVLAAGVIFGLPFMRAIPLRGAQWLAKIGADNKLYVITWVLGVFIVVPLVLIALTTWL